MPARRFALPFVGVFFAIPIHPSLAFCGFYVAKADTKLFNEASKVVLARAGDKTVITMVNDYKGEPEEFAMVIPAPKVLERGQINVGDAKVVEHLDAYTAPRLVEYFDPNPCAQLRSWTGADQCEAAEACRASLGDRFDGEARRLAGLTRWPIGDVRSKMEAVLKAVPARGSNGTEWWRRIWPEKRD